MSDNFDAVTSPMPNPSRADDEYAVLVIRVDHSKEFLPGLQVVGIWDGHVHLGSDGVGDGMDPGVQVSVSLEDLDRLEIVRRDREEYEGPEWMIEW